MHAEELKALQAPVKDRYRSTPEAALQTMSVTGEVRQDRLTVELLTKAGPLSAGLHPAAGGSGEWACSGDMLLESLVACAGVTLSAVSTAMGIVLDDARITAEGDMDFRGTLGVSRETPIGFTAIRVAFHLKSSATDEQLAKLIQLTERYCVILQTLAKPPTVSAQLVRH